jgi:hypothetical protein
MSSVPAMPDNPMKTKSPSLLLTSLIIVVLMTVGMARSQADNIALSFTGGTQSQLHNLTIGWSFSITSPLLVTQFGLWDGPGPGTGGTAGDGFGVSHDVTLWTSAGLSLATATVPSGTTATLTNGFRYVPLSVATLIPAGTYVISSYYAQASFDTSISNAATLTTDPAVTYIAGKSALNNVFPSGDLIGAGGIKSYFGPNFQFAAAVPETSSTWLLLLLGVVVIIGSRYRPARR